MSTTGIKEVRLYKLETAVSSEKLGYSGRVIATDQDNRLLDYRRDSDNPQGEVFYPQGQDSKPKYLQYFSGDGSAFRSKASYGIGKLVSLTSGDGEEKDSPKRLVAVKTISLDSFVGARRQFTFVREGHPEIHLDDLLWEAK